jgi:pimeloyl-ACP methyl ester carboxylesterase
MKALGLAVLILIGLGLIAAALLPMLLIDPTPAAGVSDPRQLAGDKAFVTIPSAGGDALDLHVVGEPGPEGASRTFMLLHGFTLNLYTWEPSFDLFAQRGRTIAYDQPPYGLSAKPVPHGDDDDSPYAKSAAIDQLFALMDRLGVQRAVLVGSSSGGTLALEAALARPERVEALVLVAPWVYVQRPTLPRWLAELPQMERIALLIARKLGDATLLEYSYLHPDRITPERRERSLIHRAQADWDLAWASLLGRSLWTPVEVAGRLAEVRQPVLLITGDGDRLVRPEDTRRVAEQLPRATLLTLPDCGHVPQEECPEAFAQAVTAWLDGLP